MPTPQGRSRGTGPTAISVAGNEEPIDPVYTEANRQSPLGTSYPIPYRDAWDPSHAPLVVRGQDTRGMRYLYADYREEIPVSPLGTGPDLGNAVWSSSFQKVAGRLKDWGFYDQLFKAGYPGFNLGISFKVQQNPSIGTQSPGANIHMTTPIRPVIVNVFRRKPFAGNTSYRQG